MFFQDDAGREALYGYLVAIAFRVAGESVTVLRGTSAVLGVLAVVAVYFWLRRRGEVVALAGATWAGGSLWLLCVSRDGMRNVLVPVGCALALWAMEAWAARPGTRRAAMAGAAMGLGLWTYQPLKLLPLLLVLWISWIRRADRGRWRSVRAGLWALALAYLVVGAPMLFTAVTQPGAYFGRAVGVAAAGGTSGPLGIVDHTVRTLLMFAITGDPNERHNVGGLPLLGWPVTVIAGLGAAVAWRQRNRPEQSLVLLAIPVFLLPPLLGFADPAPHFLRSLGLAAPIAALVGGGVAALAQLATAAGGLQRRRLVLTGTSALLVLTGAAGAYSYFSRPVAPRFYAYSFNVVQLADAARASGPGTVVVIDSYQSLDLLFLDGDLIGRPGGPVLSDPTIRLPDLPAACRLLGLYSDHFPPAFDLRPGPRAIAFDPMGRPTVWAAPCGL